MKTSLRVLIVEDSEFDAQMMVSMLRKGGYEVTFERVETSSAMKLGLSGRPWDIILADYNLPEFNAPHLASLLAANPPWALDMPLAAAGFEAYRYKKD